MKTAPTRNRGALAVARTAALAAVFFVLSCREQRVANTVKDDLNRDVAMPPRVARVITLSPNLTEMLFAVGAGEKIVATDDYSNYPAPARSLPKVGGMQPNIERIAALHPDLVLAGTEGNHPNLAPALAAAGIPLYVVRTDRLPEIARAMQRLGELLGGPRTNDAVRELNAAIERERRTRTPSPRVLFAVWTDPLYVGGRETFTDDLLRLTGAQNAVQVSGWPNYSLESLLAAPPDLILYSQGAVTPEHIAALRARVPEVTAEIIGVDEDVFQRPGPRVAEAARQLNGILDRWNAER